MKNNGQLVANAKEVFFNWRYSLLAIIVGILMWTLFSYFTDAPLIIGNIGYEYYVWTIIMEALISILFAIFIPISIYKIVKFSNYSAKENTGSVLGTFLGVVVAGCPACSISIASYLGLAGLISFLPWHGLELKLIAVPLLVYANYSILNSLNSCKVGRRK